MTLARWYRDDGAQGRTIAVGGSFASRQVPLMEIHVELDVDDSGRRKLLCLERQRVPLTVYVNPDQNGEDEWKIDD